MIYAFCGITFIALGTVLVLGGSVAFGVALYMLGGACVALGVLS